MKFKLLFLVIIFTTLNMKSQNIPLYIGTSTKGDSKGIYVFNFNTDTGELTNKTLAINIDNPSFLTYSPDKKYLYSTNATSSGFISSYKINEDGSLLLLTRVSSEGKGPCHISLNKAGTKAVVSNYGGGTISIYPINKNGHLGEASQVFNHNSENEKSHAHSAHFFDNDLFVADLGKNAIYNYELKNNTYNLKSPSIVKMTGNPGPRHFTLNKTGSFMYVINEYGSSITSIRKTSNGFEQIGYDSTLKNEFKERNDSADIHLSEDERFLYGSNRGENSIVVFKRNLKTGTLNKIQSISTHGNWPRNFTLDPTGKFLLVANRRSSGISVFKRDQKTGKLTFLHSINTPNPTCLLF